MSYPFVSVAFPPPSASGLLLSPPWTLSPGFRAKASPLVDLCMQGQRTPRVKRVACICLCFPWLRV